MKILAQCSIPVSSEMGIWPETKYGFMLGGGGGTGPVETEKERRAYRKTTP
jgi:hypothetical protein